jgi:hypothetical protein
MKLNKEVLITVIGLSNCLSIVFGVTSLTIGTSTRTLIFIGKTLQPHEQKLVQIQIYGGIATASGLTLFLAGKTFMDITSQRKARRYISQLYPSTEKVSQCKTCRFYHGIKYGENFFVCAAHPYGIPEGDRSYPDYEKNC